MSDDSPHRPRPEEVRRKLTAGDLAAAQRTIDLAWDDLPSGHRGLLEAIGADQRMAVDHPLGREISDLLRSAGLGALDETASRRLDVALGVWLPDLRVVLVDAGHGKHSGLDDRSYEAALARIAWHEWGHALSLDRATGMDVNAGDRLLDLAPRGVAEIIRNANYRSNEKTHELVAEIYALLMARRRRGQSGKPAWLANEIWDLMMRVAEWPA